MNPVREDHIWEATSKNPGGGIHWRCVKCGCPIYTSFSKTITGDGTLVDYYPSKFDFWISNERRSNPALEDCAAERERTVRVVLET